ncbi:hypothetical protein MiSe_82730 [Microseira wollei NIES-4236]|uniref:OCP N-terminal domain-containing protein n=1 Tax=Microseira wollei NIES-4236 TaxID=2530354 RepID=A0AAV3WNM9_9CYAN|nr:hypothetical protein MiSe_82730 [Microseira wollei NIES-4236]
MISSQNTIQSQALSEKNKKLVQAFEGLGTDEKLALLYLIYEKMGNSITPAAPTATEPELAPLLLPSLGKNNYLINREDTKNTKKEEERCR